MFILVCNVGNLSVFVRMNSKINLSFILLKLELEENFPVTIILRLFVRSALNSCDGTGNVGH